MPRGSAGFTHGKNGKTASDLLVELGPTLFVDVGRKSRAVAGERPDLALKNAKALIDTGAGSSCIDDRLARELGLPIHDEGQVSGIGGVHKAFYYTARLYVPQLGRLLFQQFAGVRLSEGGQFQQIILGRDFLRPYRMIYDGRTAEVFLDDAQ